MACCWADIPNDILLLILEKLFSAHDYVRFSAVCKSWHSAALDQKQSRLKSSDNQLPLLMIPTKDSSDRERSLYGITREGEGKFYDFKLRVPYNKRCCGSCYGWLAFAEKNFVVTLVNPFSGETICLPPICEDIGEFGGDYQICVKKVIFSANPSLSSRDDDDDFMVAAIFGGCCLLAFIRPGRSEGWILVKDHLPKHLKRFGAVTDVLFYKGQLYAVNQTGGVFSINFDTQSNQFKSKLVVPKTREPLVRCSYLVEAPGGDLLLVFRYVAKKDHEIQWVTVSFKVFKLVGDGEKEGQSQWVEIKCLTGGDALFLGDNHSMCVPSFLGCRPNCIYYTDDEIAVFHPLGSRDMGVFDLEDGSIGTHYSLDPSQKHMPPAIWILPTIL